MSEKLVSVMEVNGVRLGNTGGNSEKTRVGVVHMMNALFGGYCDYDGYKIETTEHVYHILIDDCQNCCESWGYFTSEDDFEDFIGKELIDIELTDTALNKIKLEENCPYFDCDESRIQFVDFKFSDGSVLQFAVYNEHNGYYGHPILVAKDGDIIHQDTL